MKKKGNEEITKIKKDNQGRMVEFITDNNKLYNYETALEAIDEGIIINAKIVTDKYGYKKIMSKKGDTFKNVQNF